MAADDGEETRGSGIERRRALRLLGILGAGVACATAAPAVVVLARPAGAGGGARWVRTVRLDALKEGEPKRVTVVADARDAWTLAKEQELGSVWLLRTGDGVEALSAECPHLGCTIRARPAAEGSGGFTCPCHDSDFDAKGKRLSGPSPRDLDPLATKIEDGAVLVDFRRFRLGTEERKET